MEENAQGQLAFMKRKMLWKSWSPNSDFQSGKLRSEPTETTRIGFRAKVSCFQEG